MNEKQWLRNGIGYLDWVIGGEPYWDNDYVKSKVERAASFNTNVLFMAVQIGGYAIYPSKYAPLAPRLEYDMLDRIRSETRQQGMRLIPYWLATAPGAALQLELHPDWQQRGPEGDPTGCMCYLSPYGRFTLGQTAEVLERYEVDGIYYDQMPVGCFCPWCAAKFKARFGRDFNEMDGVADAARNVKVKSMSNTLKALGGPHLEAEAYGGAVDSEGSLLRRFVQENMDWWVTSVSGIVNRLRPDAVYQQGKLWDSDLARYSNRVDAVLPEILWWTVGHDIDRLALSREICQLYSGQRVVWDVAKYDNGNIDRRCLEEVKLLLANGLTCGAQPFLRELRAADLAPLRLDDFRHFMTQIRQLVDLRSTAKGLYACSLLHSSEAERESPHAMGDSLTGAYRVLRENQVLFDLVRDGEVGAGLAMDRPVLVIPEYGVMPPAVEEKLVDYVNAGGNALVVLGRHTSAIESDFEARPLMRLLDMKFKGLAGTRCLGPCPSLRSVGPIPAWTRDHVNYCEIADVPPITNDIKDTIFAFSTYFVEADYGVQTNTLLHARDIDYQKYNARYFNRRIFWPGDRICPIAVTYNGKGRVAFFGVPAFHLDFLRGATEIDRLLSNVIDWLRGGPQEIEVHEAQATLRLAAYVNEQERSYVLILANQATNDLRQRAIRNVHPTGEIILKVSPRFDVTSAKALDGRPLELERDEGCIVIRVPGVRFLEGIILR
ncbi:MAG: hypothetical protein IT445_03240 [Phycisphaeraceae bacterium]|nr:hypothetical protein [Phycisphaeraceae bacterium]